MIRVLLADDQDIFRKSLVTLLSGEDDLSMIGQARNGREAIAQTKSLEPNVILMDVRMPICNGIEATRIIRQEFPLIKILVLTTFDDDEYILESLQAGALGYLLKRTPPEQIAAAIRSVYQGYSQLGPTIAHKVFSQIKSPQTKENPLLGSLCKRECEVLKYIGYGKNNQEIARILHISEGTVKNYVTQILDKLGMRDRIQVALWAQKNLI
ncbi:MAG: DNA-binding response regulator [Pseudanabaena sp.]|nr:MAG: DNA-binding response regulator [Pseudanabaena sp.]